MVQRILLLLLLSFSLPFVVGSERKIVEINLHGLNYSGSEFRYHVVDPDNPESGGGGELIDPFGTGGITCCAKLPRDWRPGVKLEVRTTYWQKNPSDQTRVKINEVHQIEVPRYPSGKPGELWVLRGSDGTISVVLSDYQPNHPSWPGKIKGWPIPSLEFRREKWEIARKHEADGVISTTKLLDDLEKYPIETAHEMWKVEKEYDPKSVIGFSGPRDPKYLASLKIRHKKGLDENKQRLQRILEIRP